MRARGEARASVLRLAASGRSDREIAERLGVSDSRVREVLCKYQEAAPTPLQSRHALIFYIQRELTEEEWQQLVAESRELWARLPTVFRNELFLRLLETWIAPEHRHRSVAEFVPVSGVRTRYQLLEMVRQSLNALGQYQQYKQSRYLYVRLLVIYRAAVHGTRDS